MSSILSDGTHRCFPVGKIVIVSTPEEAVAAREKHTTKKGKLHGASNLSTGAETLKEMPNNDLFLCPEIDALTCKLVTPGDPRKVFKKMRVAGQGGFGMVFQGTAPDRKQWAIKRMPHSSDKERLANLREASFLKGCQHQNICAFKAVYECVAQHELYLIMVRFLF